MDLRDDIQQIALEWPSYGRPRITQELTLPHLFVPSLPNQVLLSLRCNDELLPT